MFGLLSSFTQKDVLSVWSMRLASSAIFRCKGKEIKRIRRMRSGAVDMLWISALSYGKCLILHILKAGNSTIPFGTIVSDQAL